MADAKIHQLTPGGDAVHVVVVFEPQSGKMAEIEETISKGSKVLEGLPGCVAWHATKAEDGNTLVLTQSWTNAEAMQEHGKSEGSQKTRESLKALLAKPPTTYVTKTITGFVRAM